jgi:beta-glucosidase
MPTFTQSGLIGICAATILTIMTTSSTSQNIDPYKNSTLPIEQRVDDLLSRMTLDEKMDLLAGKNGGETMDIPRLGIPSLKVIDGPHGVGWGTKATCFPTDISMAASWNPGLVYSVGQALGDETRAAGRNVLLGPCVNIHRTPLGGRNFESFGEDPYLSGRMAVSYIKGVQSRKIGTSLKHYACNNQEWERTTISVELDERALREIYLPAFKAAVTEADPWTVMGAYNKVRGKWCCENPMLLNDILKHEWGFKGFVVSDWGATHSVADAANAGLDLEMGGPGEYFNRNRMGAAVKAGEVKESVIDDKVSRLLRVFFLAGLFDKPDPALAGSISTPEHLALARQLAEEAITLLKNDRGTLPLDVRKLKKIAVIGPNAAVARLGGGGSSTVQPESSVSPLQGIRNLCGADVEVGYAQGCSTSELQTIDTQYLLPPDAKPGEHGLKAEYFANKDLAGDPAVTRIDPQVNFDWGGGSPDPAIPGDNFSARWTGRMTVPVTAKYALGLAADDGFRLFLDGELFIDHWVLHSGSAVTKEVALEGGREYDVKIEYFENLGGAVAKFGWVRSDNMLDEAVALARNADLVLLFMGLSSVMEGEGYDRPSLRLPEDQDELIKAIAEANPNTVVVLNNGTPVEMDPWLDSVPAVVEAWYPGQAGGDAVAGVIFGKVNPSGKLPFTFPKKLADNPTFGNYPGSDNVVHYAEGIFVGYRYYDTKNVEPLFPFGHGLSYTTFEYSDLNIDGKIDNGLKINISLSVKNSGSRAGDEVVQLYVRDIASSLERPLKELKAFKKVGLKPGETKQVQFELGERDLAFYDPARGRWVAEPGEFEILAGSSSRDIRLTGKYVFRGE